jgi:molybdopterin converting factor small subunit
MMIKVQLGEPLWRQVGSKNLDLELEENATVGTLIDRLVQAYPSLSESLTNDELPATVFLNDELVDRETPLQDGDHPMLIWAITGG